MNSSENKPEPLLEDILNLRQKIHKLFNVKKAVKHESDKEEILMPSLRDKIDILTRYGLIPWIIRKNEKLYILNDICGVFTHTLPLNLNEIAVALGLRDKFSSEVQITTGKISFRASALVLTIDEFAEILNPQVLD